MAVHSPGSPSGGKAILTLCFALPLAIDFVSLRNHLLLCSQMMNRTGHSHKQQWLLMLLLLLLPPGQMPTYVPAGFVLNSAGAALTD
jgi:hypothetical protein